MTALAVRRLKVHDALSYRNASWFAAGVLLVFEACWMLLDVINGWFMHSGGRFFGNAGVGSLLRLPAVVLGLYLLVRRRRFATSPLPYLVLWFLPISVAHLCLGEQTSLVNNTYGFLKHLVPLLFFHVVATQIRQFDLNAKAIRIIVLVNSTILGINLVLPFLGIGHSVYGRSSTGLILGARGFFWASNDLSVAYLALYSLSLILWLHTRGIGSRLMLVLWFLGGVALFSKTAIFGFVVLSIVAWFCSRGKSRIRTRAVVVVGATLAVTSSAWKPMLQGVSNRWQSQVKISDTVGYYFGTNRVKRAQRNFNIHEDHLGMLIFFGVGWSGQRTSENGFFDALQAFGLLSIAIYSIWASWFVTAFLNWRRHRDWRIGIACGSLGIIIVVSILAGHTLQSAMAAPFVALLANTHRWIVPATKNTTPVRSGCRSSCV